MPYPFDDVKLRITERQSMGFAKSRLVEWLQGLAENVATMDDVKNVATMDDVKNMETGIVDAHLAIGLLLNYARQNGWEIERGSVNLTNSESFPFNNSVQTTNLEKEFDSKDYIVLTEIESANGNAGEVEISDKLTNGFKIAFNGSAKSANVKYTVLGGFMK